MSFGVCWCLMSSGDVGRVSEEFLKGYLSALYGQVKVAVHLKVFLSVLTLYGDANALYWKSFESQNSTLLALLKHQITK